MNSIIKQRRIDLGLTQQELANLTNLTPEYICQLENNKRTPSITTVRKLSTHLRLPTSTILDSFAEGGGKR